MKLNYSFVEEPQQLYLTYMESQVMNIGSFILWNCYIDFNAIILELI